MTPHVLILSGLYDFSTDLVVLRLEESSVPYLRLNREHLAQNRFALDPVTQTLTVRCSRLTYNIDATALKTIWYRQPVFLRNTPPIPLSPAEQLERSQWSAFLRSLCLFRDVAWMNFPGATYLAESKPYQLAVAHDCGFEVPQTFVTNDSECVRAAFSGDFIVKSLDTALLRDGEDCLFTYTTVNSSSSEEFCDETVRAVPLLAQRNLTDKVDIRVTVVGDDVFAVRILSRGRGIQGDWRTVPRDDVSYFDVVLDDDVLQSCSLLTRTLGLGFAAIDLIETTHGIYFIEVNPTGEWGWLSSSHRPIDKAIAGWLKNPTARNARHECISGL